MNTNRSLYSEDEQTIQEVNEVGPWHHHKERREAYQTLIKPTPPEKYSRKPDLGLFQQFMTQSALYLKFGYVPWDRHVLIISGFLKRWAWTYYSQFASRAPKEWSLNWFFVELFNKCFFLDFCNKQQEALKNYIQEKLTIHDYSAGLEELFTMVGHVSNKEKVVTLFNSFQKGVQKWLYLMGLNPEISEWDKVVEKATYVEQADSLDWDDKNAWQGENFNRKADGAPSGENDYQQGLFSNHKNKGAWQLLKGKKLKIELIRATPVYV